MPSILQMLKIYLWTLNIYIEDGVWNDFFYPIPVPPFCFFYSYTVLCSNVSSLLTSFLDCIHLTTKEMKSTFSQVYMTYTLSKNKTEPEVFFLFVLGLFSRLFFLRCSVNVLAKWRLALLKNFPSSSIKSGGSEGTCNVLEKPGSWRLC